MPARYSYGNRDLRAAPEDSTWRAGASSISVDLPSPADAAADGEDRAMPLVEVEPTAQHGWSSCSAPHTGAEPTVPPIPRCEQGTGSAQSQAG